MRLYVLLTSEEFDQLAEAARRKRRRLQDQAAHLIAQGLCETVGSTVESESPDAGEAEQ